MSKQLIDFEHGTLTRFAGGLAVGISPPEVCYQIETRPRSTTPDVAVMTEDEAVVVALAILHDICVRKLHGGRYFE